MPLVDNNKVQTGSRDQAPRVVPEVLVVQKSLNFTDFTNLFLPGRMLLIWKIDSDVISSRIRENLSAVFLSSSSSVIGFLMRQILGFISVIMHEEGRLVRRCR